MKAFYQELKLLTLIAFCTQLCWLHPCITNAQTIDVKQAMKKAQAIPLRNDTGARKAGSRKTSNEEPALAYTSTSNGHTLYYVFNYPDGGFAIIGGDVAAREVLGYCPEGSFEIDKIPVGLRDMLGMYNEQIEQAIANPVPKRSLSRAASGSVEAQYKVNIDPLIKTTWGQRAPYNEALPLIKEGYTDEKALATGCVATALSQIMYYYKYPTSGKDSKSFSKSVLYDKTQHITLFFSADFENTVYDWQNMLEDYSKGANDVQKKAVSTLMYHIGVASDAEYGQSSTNIYSNKALEGLSTHFGYSQHYCYLRENFSDWDWEDMIYNELLNGRPVLYTGRTPMEHKPSSNLIEWVIGTNEGHAFICDGYNPLLDFYHFNWGWGGGCDGYYPISGTYALAPNITKIGGPNKEPVYIFQNTQAVWLNILPQVVKIKSVSIKTPSIELPTGSSMALGVDIKPVYATDKKITWNSSNTDVATVSQEGVVMALSNGTATITASSQDGSNKSSSCIVYVSDKHSVTIGHNETSKGYAPFGNAYPCATTEMIFTSDELGGSGSITSLSFYVGRSLPLESEVTIDMGYVNQPFFDSKTQPRGILTQVKKDHGTIGMKDGWEEYVFNTEFDYDGKSDLLVVITRKSEDYASLLSYAHSTTLMPQCIYRMAQDAVSLPNTKFQASLTRPYVKFKYFQELNNPVSSISFPSSSLSIQKGESMSLNIDILPENATDKTVSWKSSDINVVRVSSNGELSALKEGKVTITATSKSNSQLVATCEVTVIGDDYSSENLKKLEYWFDNKINQRNSISLSSSTEYLDIQIPTTGITEGFHWLRMRTQNTNGEYSAITSSPFIKSNAENANQIEYWFDDNYANHSVMSMKQSNSTAGKYQADLDLSDAKRFPFGFHRLNYRITSAEGLYSSVSSAYIFRVGVGDPSLLEYWVDDDLAHCRTASGQKTSDGNYIITADLDLNDVTPGFHRLYYRVKSQDRGTVGAISMTNIIHLGTSEPSYLEYWIDDDIEHSCIVKGQSTGNNYNITAELNLNDVSTGFHRLYYRVTTADKHGIGAVSMTPIMVKSLYNPDTSDDLKVTKLRYTIDDKKTRNIDVLKYGSVVEVIRDEDLRDLAAGEHVIKYQAQNSASLWSEMHQATFTIVEPEVPTISIQASVSADGLVSYTFNTIPNDKRYKVQRYTSPDDRSPVTVNSYEKDGNALQLTGVDNPANGKYYYRVLASYTDKDGNSASIRSELQEVTVTNAHPTTEKMGVVYGRVVFENLPTGQLPYGKTKIINFSDGKTVTTDGQGMFRREGVPFGKELTLTVADDALYTYDTKSVKPMADVHNGEVSAVIRGSIKPDVTNTNVDDPEYNLYINSKIKLDQENLTLTFKVKNNSGKPWRGRIGISASEISTKNYELAFEAAKQIMYYQWSSSDQITTGIESFGIDEQKEFTFKLSEIERLKNIPEGKSEMYDFHIQYKGDDDYVWHTLGSNEAYSIQNPYPLNVESFIKDFEWTAETIEIAEEEIVKYIKDLKQTKKWVDYGKSADDFLAESIGFKGAKSEAALFKSISSKLKFVIEAGDKLTAPFEAVKKFYKEYEEYESLKNIQNPIEKYYAYVHFIWKYAEKDPIAKMYGELLKTYCDVGAVLAEKAMSFSSVTDSYGLGDLLYNGKLKFDLKFHYYFDNYLWYVSLPEAKNSSKEQQEIHKVIKSVELEIYDQSMNRVKVIDCALNINGNDIIAIPRGREDYGYQRHYILTIKWANGRVTNVPLISNNDIEANYFENYSHVILDFESPYKNYWYQGLADEIILKKSKAK